MKLRQQIKIIKNFMNFMVCKEGDSYYCFRDIYDKKTRHMYSRKQFFQAIRGFRPKVMEHIRKCQDNFYKQIKIVTKPTNQ